MMWGAPGAAERSIRPYRSSQQYLCAMKEDLAEWLKELYDLDIEAGTFLEVLETGAVLCSHANHVAHAAGEFARACPAAARHLRLPAAGVACNLAAQPGTFQARDNVSNFIQWCRKEMGIKGKASGSSSPGMRRAVPLQLLLASPSVFSRVSPRPVPPQRWAVPELGFLHQAGLAQTPPSLVVALRGAGTWWMRLLGWKNGDGNGKGTWEGHKGARPRHARHHLGHKDREHPGSEQGVSPCPHQQWCLGSATGME